MKYFLSILLLLGLVSCSGSKSKQDVEGDEAGIELADSDEFSEDSEESGEDVVAGNLEVEEEQSSAPQIELSGEEAVYTVQKNETLMMIAFKLYGDYTKWRELSALNGRSNVEEGMQIKYNKPSQAFSWSPDGNPYLIKSGDTLGKISDTTYGTTKHWKDIWQNNKPLIRDPNKIFAGFTIYTPLIDGRDVANNDDLSDL
jgi:nucleoid-associated protein YgaU